MGLSASQARLLSLTNRQHTIESQAQAYQERKALLANNSDAVYKKYVNALDNTMLKTIQTNSDNGGSSWINGTLNNLMRNGSSMKTSGNVFYVQDLQTGKLYMPENMSYETVTSKEDYTSETGNITLATALSNVTGTTLEEQARSFAEQFGVKYTKKDINESVRLNYENAVAAGWDKALATTDEKSDAIYNDYVAAKAKDDKRTGLANSALGCIPSTDSNGVYTSCTDLQSTYMSYRNFARDIIAEFGDSSTGNTLSVKSGSDSLYTAAELNLIRASLDIYDNAIAAIREKFPDGTIDLSEKGVVTGSRTHDLQEISVKTSGSTTSNYVANAFADNTTWKDKTLDLGSQYLVMLNGGTMTAKGTNTVSLKFASPILGRSGTNTYDQTENIDVYGLKDVSGKTYSQLLTDCGFSGKSFGDALQSIFERVGDTKTYVSSFLESNKITVNDLENYNRYKDYKAQYKVYLSSGTEYEYIPSDKGKADQYEQMYMALVSCGTSNTSSAETEGKTKAEKYKIYASNGYIGCNDTRSKNLTWVSNMVKNAQVVLATWDSETQMLSKTSPSLNTKLRQVKDDALVEQASQEYEEALDEIKQKDNAYDTKLEQLETERSAIDTEVQSLKDIINANIEKHFKAFG